MSKTSVSTTVTVAYQELDVTFEPGVEFLVGQAQSAEIEAVVKDRDAGADGRQLSFDWRMMTAAYDAGAVEPSATLVRPLA